MNKGAADLEIVVHKNLLLIPAMLDNSLIAFFKIGDSNVYYSKNLSKFYNNIKVLDNISFSLEEN